MNIYETVQNIEGRWVTRVKSSLFYISGLFALISGIALVVNEVYFGLALILVVCPFLMMYPSVRALMLGGDSVGAVLITAFLDYWLNKKLRSGDTSDKRNR